MNVHLPTTQASGKREAAIAKLAELASECVSEDGHIAADDVLCDLLRTLGYGDVVDAYDEVGKWYV